MGKIGLEVVSLLSLDHMISSVSGIWHLGYCTPQLQKNYIATQIIDTE